MEELAGQRRDRRRGGGDDQMLVFGVDEQVGHDLGVLFDDGKKLNRMNAVHR